MILSALPSRQREVLRLHCDGLSVSDVAARMGITSNSLCLATAGSRHGQENALMLNDPVL